MQVAGGGGEASRTRHTSRGKMLARQRVDLLIDPGTAFLELSPLAAYGLYGGDVHSASIVTGRRADLGARMRDRRQRCDHQGRHLLSDDGEEASSRPGHRAAEQSALRLHGRFRRRVPAAAGRDFPRRAAFRPHLLQSGADVGAGHSADCDRDGFLHGRRRLCSGDVGRKHHRAQSGHDFSRRAAAGEGRDRGSGHGGRTRRRRRAFAAIRRHRSLCAERLRMRSALRGASSPR